MTHEEIASMIASINLPFTYYSFPEKEAPELPYVLFYYPGNAAESADNEEWGNVTALNLELYTKEKSFDDEKKVESVLKETGFPFIKSETYLNDEHMFEVLYEMEVVING